MTSSLSNRDNDLSKRIHELNVNTNSMIKNVKHVELNISILTVFFNIQTLNMI